MILTSVLNLLGLVLIIISLWYNSRDVLLVAIAFLSLSIAEGVLRLNKMKIKEMKSGIKQL